MRQGIDVKSESVNNKKTMKRILLCQHCGNKTSHTILDEVIEKEDITTELGDEFSVDNYFLFTICDSCEKHSLFYCFEGDYNESSCLWPNERHLSDAVPKEITDAYFEAIKIKKLSKMGFLMLIRRSLEILCKYEKITGKDLFKKIENLGSKNIIPQNLVEMANLIRLLGNDSAHDNNIDISNPEIELLDEFFISIIEYVYIAPSKINNLKKKLMKK